MKKKDFAILLGIINLILLLGKKQKPQTISGKGKRVNSKTGKKPRSWGNLKRLLVPFVFIGALPWKGLRWALPKVRGKEKNLAGFATIVLLGLVLVALLLDVFGLKKEDREAAFVPTPVPTVAVQSTPVPQAPTAEAFSRLASVVVQPTQPPQESLLTVTMPTLVPISVAPPDNAFVCLRYSNANWQGAPDQVTPDLTNIYFDFEWGTGRLVSMECKGRFAAGTYTYEYNVEGGLEILVAGNLAVDLRNNEGYKNGSKRVLLEKKEEVILRYQQKSLRGYASVVLNWIFEESSASGSTLTQQLIDSVSTSTPLTPPAGARNLKPCELMLSDKVLTGEDIFPGKDPWMFPLYVGKGCAYDLDFEVEKPSWLQAGFATAASRDSIVETKGKVTRSMPEGGYLYVFLWVDPGESPSEKAENIKVRAESNSELVSSITITKSLNLPESLIAEPTYAFNEAKHTIDVGGWIKNSGGDQLIRNVEVKNCSPEAIEEGSVFKGIDPVNPIFVKGGQVILLESEVLISPHVRPSSSKAWCDLSFRRISRTQTMEEIRGE